MKPQKLDCFQAPRFPGMPHQDVDLQMHPIELSQKKNKETELLGEVVATDAWNDNTNMQEIITSAKVMISENILQSFQHVQAICKLAEKERDQTKSKKKEFLRVVAADHKKMYLPNTQVSATKNPDGESESLTKFQDLVSLLIERSFVQSGLITRSLQLEKQNKKLYQIASEENLQQHDNNQREMSPLQLAEWPSYEGEPDQMEMTRSPKFKSNFEHIKVQILKRIKQNTELYLKNKINSDDSPQKMMSGMDADTSDLQSYQDFKFTPDALIGENEFFKEVQVQVIQTLIQQRNIIQKFYMEQVDKIQNMNYELRKSFLKELQLLRETYFQSSNQKIDRETAMNYSRVHLFQFEQGLDQNICDLLNEKIVLVSQQFISEIQQYKQIVKFQKQTIQKYVNLTPKTFKLMQLTLQEIFEALAIINKDSFDIWKHLTAAYPQDYFVGVIEAEFGAFFDAESEARLKQEVIDINNSLQEQVDKTSVAFQKEKMKIYELIDEKDVLLDKIREEHKEQIEFHEEIFENSMKKKVSYEQAKLKAKYEAEHLELYEKLNRTKKKYKELKKIHVSNETKLSFFKWKLIVQAFRQKGDRHKIDIDGLKKILTDDQLLKQDNSNDQKEEKLQLYKYLYEESRKEHSELQVKYNEILTENTVLQGKIDIVSNAHETFQNYAFKNLFPKMKEIESENVTLKTKIKSCLKLVAKTDTQKVMIEEKFNIKQHKNDIDPKHRVVIRLLNEFQIETESARTIIQNKLEKASIMRPGATNFQESKYLESKESPRKSTHPDETVSNDGLESKSGPISRKQFSHAQVQTDIQNTNLALRLINEDPERQPEEIGIPKFDQESQTTVDFRKWHKMEEYQYICDNLEKKGHVIADVTKSKVPKKQPNLNRRMGIRRSGTATSLQFNSGQQNSRNSDNESRQGSFKRSNSKLPTQMRALGGFSSGSLKNVVAKAASKFKKGADNKRVLGKLADGKKKNTKDDGTASSKSLSDGKGQINNTIENIDEDVNELENSSQQSSSSHPTSSQDSLSEELSKPQDKEGSRDSQKKHKVTEEHLKTFESIPTYPYSVAPRIVDMKFNQQEYDNLKSLFELNIDIVDEIKRNHQNIYQEVIADLREQDQLNMLNSNKLLDSSKRWLKKLYKSQYRQKITDLHTKKQEQKQNDAQLEKDALIFLKKLPILKNCIMKAINSKDKMQQKQAHSQLIKQLTKIKSDGVDIDKIPLSYETSPNKFSGKLNKQIGISGGKMNIGQQTIVSLNENSQLEKGMTNQRMKKTTSPHVKKKLNMRQMQRIQQQNQTLPFAQMTQPKIESSMSTQRQYMQHNKLNDDIKNELTDQPDLKQQPLVVPTSPILIESGQTTGNPSQHATFVEGANKEKQQENEQVNPSARASQTSPLYQQIWNDQTVVSSPSIIPDVQNNNEATIPDQNLQQEVKNEEVEQEPAAETAKQTVIQSAKTHSSRQIVLSREGQTQEDSADLNQTNQSQDMVLFLDSKEPALLGEKLQKQFSSLTPQNEKIELIVTRGREPNNDNAQEFELIQQQFQQFEQLNQIVDTAQINSSATINFNQIDEIMKKETSSRTNSTIPVDSDTKENAQKHRKFQHNKKMRPLTTRLLSKNMKAMNSGGIHVMGKKINQEGDPYSIPNVMLKSHDGKMLMKDFLIQQTDQGLRSSKPELFKQITQSGSTQFEALKIKQGSDTVISTDSAVRMRQSFNSTFKFETNNSATSPNSHRIHQQFTGGGQFGAAKPQLKISVENIDSDALTKREKLQDFFHNKKKMKSNLHQSHVVNTRLKSARVGKSALINSQIRFNPNNMGTVNVSRMQSGKSTRSSYNRVVANAAKQLFSPRNKVSNQQISQGASRISRNYQTINQPIQNLISHPIMNTQQANNESLNPDKKLNLNIISAESNFSNQRAPTAIQAGKARYHAGSVMTPQYIASEAGETNAMGEVMNRTIEDDPDGFGQSIIYRLPTNLPTNLQVPFFK